jgi:hypothetical protein
MPRFRADIEVFFDAKTQAEAEQVADAMGDAISDDARLDGAGITAITSGVTPTPAPAPAIEHYGGYFGGS